MFDESNLKPLTDIDRIQILKNTRDTLYHALENASWGPQDYESVIKTLERIEKLLRNK